MARKATGEVIPPKGKQRSFAIRFTANGSHRSVTLGRPEDGWNRQRAEAELERTLAQVKLGQWQPPSKVEAPPADEPSFHEFASQWFERHRPEWRERTVEDYQWALSHHLLPHFAEHRLSEITIEEVDAYKAAKLREGNLGAAQINKTLVRLGQVLEEAVEYGHLPTNPARGRRRRVKASPPRRSWVEPEQVPSLLDGASSYMRPIVATLIGAGLRVSEAVALDWSDVNLATGTLRVGKAKTDAGTYREVDLPGGLVDELTEWKLRGADELAKWKKANRDRGDPVFLSRHARRVRRQSAANVARRLKTAINHANRGLEQLGIEQISKRVTPHSLRRTYASLRAASGDDPVYIAEQLGHTDPRFTVIVYTKAVKRRSKLSGEYLAEYERALAWAALPSSEMAEKGRISETESPRLTELPSDLA